MPEQPQTVTTAQALAHIETALNALIDQVGDQINDNGTATVAQITAMLASLRSELIPADTPEWAQNLKSLSDTVMTQHEAQQTQLDTLYAKAQANLDQINALNDVYATDDELAQRVVEISEAWATADNNVKALVEQRITTDDAQQLVTQAQQDAQSYADQKIALALDNVATLLNNSLATAG